MPSIADTIRITGLTTRRLRLSSDLWFEGRTTPDSAVPWFEFPFTVVETNEGVEGYTMGYGPLGQGRASAYHIHDVYHHDLAGRNPLHHEAIWQDLRRKQRHLYSMAETTWADLDVANLHVACSTESGRFLESHHSMFRFGLKDDPLAVKPDGCQHLPDGPGLGVEIDWDWIEDHTVETIKGSTL